jgi:hypothetical protein
VELVSDLINSSGYAKLQLFLTPATSTIFVCLSEAFIGELLQRSAPSATLR